MYGMQRAAEVVAVSLQRRAHRRVVDGEPVRARCARSWWPAPRRVSLRMEARKHLLAWCVTALGAVSSPERSDREEESLRGSRASRSADGVVGGEAHDFVHGHSLCCDARTSTSRSAMSTRGRWERPVPVLVLDAMKHNVHHALTNEVGYDVERRARAGDVLVVADLEERARAQVVFHTPPRRRHPADELAEAAHRSTRSGARDARLAAQSHPDSSCRSPKTFDLRDLAPLLTATVVARARRRAR